ncbi:helix-turn-helix transcriptional regulator [Microbacterium sp. NPDC089189]|uniref:helix-turn-helix transcriptional regulator n=1 Tax=Microbacterium sp. NPDC089189 TaxID=3154972 RepID=UPI003429A26C
MNLTDRALAHRALRAAVEGGSADAIAAAAMDNIWPLYSAHFEELAAAIESLPGALLERSPVLRIVHRMTPVLARTTRPFKPLLYPGDARSMSEDELDILTLVQMVGFRLSGDVAAALVYARRLESRISQSRIDARDRTDGPLWFYHQQIGSTLLAAGDSAAALSQLATARQLGRLAPQPDAERMALGRIALAHAVRGSLDDADRALAELAAQRPVTAAHTASSSTTEHTARALIGVERMVPDAEDLLSRLEPYDSIELSWPFALLARTRALFALQRPDEAIEAVRLSSEAHPAQHGSFASDVIAAASIEGFWAIGARNRAASVAEASSRVGLLSRVAIVRHALLDSRLDTAGDELRRLTREAALGPGQRAELTLLSAWLEHERAGAVADTTARHVFRLATRDALRRVVATMPVQLMHDVGEALDPIDSTAFDAATLPLVHVDVPRRPELTRAELRVLRALSDHTTTTAIAAAFRVSPHTVKSQLTSVYRKLGCSSRGEAIRAAARLRIVAYDEA